MGRIILIFSCVLLSMSTVATRAGADMAERLENLQGLFYAGQFAAARDTAQAIIFETERTADKPSLAAALLKLSDAHYYLGNHAQTLPPIERALGIFREIGDDTGIGRSYYSLAYFYERTDPARMIELLEEGLIYTERSGDRQFSMNIANAMGSAQFNQGQYAAAILSFGKAAELAGDLEAVSALATANQNIGLIHMHQGNNIKALEYFDLALAAVREIDETHSIAIVLGNAGNAHLGLYDFEAGLDCYERALAIHRESGYQRGICVQLSNISSVYERLQDLEHAAELRREALELAIQTEDKRGIIQTMSYLGQLHVSLGDLIQARDYFEQAHARATEFGDPFLLSDLEVKQAQMAYTNGDGDLAVAKLSRAEVNARQVEDRNSLAIIMAKRAEWAAAAGDHESAVAGFRDAIDLHLALETNLNLHYYYSRLGQSLAALGRIEDAERAFDNSLAHIDELDARIAMGEFRVSLFAEVAAIYSAYSGWLGDRGHLLRAWSVLDRGRARQLALRIQQGRHQVDFTPAELTVLTRISTLQRRLRTEALTGAEQIDLRAEIVAAEYEYNRACRRSAGNSGITSESQFELPASPVVTVAYAVAGDTLRVYSNGPNGLRLRKVAAARQLLERISLYLDLIADPDSGDHHRVAGQSLFKTLLGPELEGHASEQLVIVPDDRLWSLPFAALRDDQGRYLSERMTVSLVPSLTILHGLTQLPAGANRRILATANTRFDESAVGADALAQLEDTPVEAIRVGRLAHGSTVLQEADEEQVKENLVDGYQLIHLATHTLIDLEHPNRSSIVFAPTSSEDGYLQVREIARLPLDCSLMVVSGCSSGRGQVVAGEGLLGLTHALLSAGSRCVTLSRWPVADAAAAVFMQEFYRALPTHSVDRSLQIARNRLQGMERWAHPAVWAAFYVAGDGAQTLDLPRRRPWSRMSLPVAGCIILLLVIALRRR
ncbi:MAG: CHAT domain-containing protein [bacterium]|nr:CHAT domain-containing protein [bacterium]